MDTINAHIKKIIYKADDSNFTICLFDVEDKYTDLTAKGKMSIEEGQDYVFSGEFKDDPKYGEFFSVNVCEAITLSSGDEIINYLTSKRFTGVGLRTAKKIYNNFKEESLSIIEESPEKLKEIGISDNIIEELTQKHQVQNIHAKLYELLTPIRISDYVIANLYDYIDVYKIKNYVQILQNNPYQFISDVYGFTFSIADKIFLHFNEDLDNTYIRISNLIKFYVYDKCFVTGDTKILQSEVEKYIKDNLNINNNQYIEVINEMINTNEIYVHEDYFVNDVFMQNIEELSLNITIRKRIIEEEYEEHSLLSYISSLEDEYKINYSEVQKETIISSLNNNISIITGGPGTGKTTIINAIANIFCKINNCESEKNQKVLLCAPTGRAAQRMHETTNFRSKTIHSALHWDPHNATFQKNEDDNLVEELIIIDEFSMVDIFVANALFKAIRPYAKIIIVGDPAQLESVGPGSVLRDMIDTNEITVNQLDTIFRQGEGSSIAKLAHDIDLEHNIKLINTKDMGVIHRKGNLVEFVNSIVNKSKDAKYGESDIQVLYPKYKGINGIDNLNDVLKPNRSEELINANNTTYQVNDKVMQLKNNYDKEIYNGDIGFITKIHNSEPNGNELAIEVDFGRITVSLSRKDMDDITHAYAISIHKSQGSEFKVVIIPLSSESKNMLSKKLIYTAITRAKDKLILIGDLSYLENGIKLTDYQRKTLLKDYIIRRNQ